MQTQPIYKSAEELGIEQWERDGLAELVGLLSRGALPFHMAPSVNECGTAGCIGGWLAMRAGADVEGVKSFMLEAYDRWPTRNLFWPWGAAMAASADQAARAITNFLVTGDPQWPKVMAA